MAAPIRLSNRDDYALLHESAVAGSFATVGPDLMTQVSELAFYTVFSADAVGGAVIIESAHSLHHQGEWHKIAQVEWVKGGKVHYTAIPGVHLYVRVRVLSPVVGGTVSVYAVAN